MLEQHINTLSLSLSFSLSHILSLHPQTCCPTPARPSLTQSRQSSAKELSSFSGHFTKIDNAKCVSSERGKEKLNAEARISKSVRSLASRGSPSLLSSGHSPKKNKKERTLASPRVPVNSGYQQPTVSSRTRALSPYTHRKMCQLSDDAQQRLSHLQLGPHHFRKETKSQQPFLVGNIRCISPEWRQLTKTSYDGLFMPIKHMFSGQGF